MSDKQRIEYLLGLLRGSIMYLKVHLQNQATAYPHLVMLVADIEAEINAERGERTDG